MCSIRLVVLARRLPREIPGKLIQILPDSGSNTTRLTSEEGVVYCTFDWQIPLLWHITNEMVTRMNDMEAQEAIRGRAWVRRRENGLLRGGIPDLFKKTLITT
jgi:hypothetical protein